MIEELKCEVCGQPAIGVCSSVFGPVSNAGCRSCIEQGIEPYSNLVGGLSGIESIESVAEWAKPYIQATLSYYNKLEEQLFADIKNNDDSYIAYTREYEE